MKKILLVVSTISFLLLGTAVFAEEKIGVVDLDKVVFESPQFSKAKADIKKKFDAREKELVESQKAFQKDIEKFSKNSPTMKAEEQKAEQNKLMEKQKKMQEAQARFQNDYAADQNKAMKDIYKKVESIVNNLAEEKKLSLIFVKNSLVFSKKEFDVTDDVMKQMKK